MKYRRLGDTGMKISEVGLGGWLTFGNALSLDNARLVMDAAFDAGVTFLDNADVYATGECEDDDLKSSQAAIGHVRILIHGRALHVN